MIRNSLVVCIITLFFNNYSYTQPSCPTWDRRNNGNDNEACGDATGKPAGYVKTGTFEFTNASYGTTLNRSKVWKNGVLYQDGASLVTPNTAWFGNYFVESATKKKICFYADNVNGVAPAASWKFELTDGTNTITCTYDINSSGNITSFSAGSITTDQTICSGSAPAKLTSQNDASSCSSSGMIAYQWQKSTNSTTTGFENISGATSNEYTPGALTQTSYFQRRAFCPTDSSYKLSNVVTITVSQIAGTISPTPGTTWSGATTTFSTSGTSGGTWSLTTSPATGVAEIHPTTGVLTASSAGTGTVTYTVTSGSLTCSSTRNFTISGTSGSLPVTWETVSAEKQNGQSVLRWSTASEQNTKDFVIQHSLNTTDWSVLSTIPAAGNSTTTRNYSYVHQNPLKGNNYNYYRILQRDLDDKFSYSKIVSIVFNEPGADLQVYPNPAEDVVTVFISEEQEVSLLNAAGALVWKSKLPAGKSQLPLEKFSSGLYFLRTKTQTIKLLIK